ncbi:autotransporter outer membrane beta-barrel domain-containing protein [Rhizobium sp. AN80A]|uniref:autotransporter family protein n=1 Tax=Rhizobium sp. AN80A TaxID=3040673 RepID=UPI0024B3AC0C|nr:autotransporter outer membrane beta-barrel domain-containing protein [Rhizobium sp. AN80A]
MALGVGATLSPALAATYTAGTEAELSSAIAGANADGDANATIKLTGNLATTGVMPSPSKPITIDTQGFTLSGFQALSSNGQALVFSGTAVGGTAQRGFYFTATTVATNFVNNGSITGGADGSATTSSGISFAGTGTFVNNGTVTGGEDISAGVGGGSGIVAQRAMAITNNGLIQGGNSASSAGGIGVNLGGFATAAVPASLINNGTIIGGTGASGGGTGVRLATGATYLENNGTIIGGTGSNGITFTIANTYIVNSGIIRGGAGATNAIGIGSPGASLTLELREGSDITGYVIGSATVSDRLRLGGSGTDSFDISQVGNTLAYQYRNFDVFEKTGTGTWTLTGAATSATDWTVYDGTLLVGDAGTTASILGNIDNRATLGGSGTIVGNVTNSGTVAPIGTLTISGDYIGGGGTVAIDAALAGDASTTDRLVVTGDTAGTGTVRVTNLGGSGAQTVEGIKIIDVGGISAGTFTLAGDYVYNGEQAVVGGAYAYRLYQNGVSTPVDGDWYLRSVLLDPALGTTTPLYQPGVAIYEAYPEMLQALNGLGTLKQRVGDRYWRTATDPVAASGPDGVWFRTGGMHGGVDPGFSTSGGSYDYNLWKSEGGVDGELFQNDSGRLIGGVSAHLGTISGDISSIYGNGKVDTLGYGVGATLTWYGEDGFYADAQSQATFYDTDLKSDLLDGSLTDGNSGFGYALSIETGRRFATSGAWTITPQAQLVYSSVNFNDFRDRFGAAVSLDRGDSLNGRIGVALDHDASWQRADGKTANAKLYGSADLYYEFLDGSAVNVADLVFGSENDRLAAGITLGGEYSWNDGRTSVYGEVIARSSLENVGDSYTVGGTAGLRVKW